MPTVSGAAGSTRLDFHRIPVRVLHRGDPGDVEPSRGPRERQRPACRQPRSPHAESDGSAPVDFFLELLRKEMIAALALAAHPGSGTLRRSLCCCGPRHLAVSPSGGPSGGSCPSGRGSGGGCCTRRLALQAGGGALREGTAAAREGAQVACLRVCPCEHRACRGAACEQGSGRCL